MQTKQIQHKQARDLGISQIPQKQEPHPQCIQGFPRPSMWWPVNNIPKKSKNCHGHRVTNKRKIIMFYTYSISRLIVWSSRNLKAYPDGGLSWLIHGRSSQRSMLYITAFTSKTKLLVVSTQERRSIVKYQSLKKTRDWIPYRSGQLDISLWSFTC